MKVHPKLNRYWSASRSYEIIRISHQFTKRKIVMNCREIALVNFHFMPKGFSVNQSWRRVPIKTLQCIIYIYFVIFSDPVNLSSSLECAKTVFHAFLMRYAAWQRWQRRCLLGQRFTWFPLRASGGSHLLEISRSRWPQAPRGVQPYHSANLSDRWVYCCTPHTQKPQHWSQRRKIPLRGFSAFLLLSSLAPVVHSPCLMLCETVNTELGDVNGLPGIRGGVRGESLY